MNVEHFGTYETVSDVVGAYANLDITWTTGKFIFVVMKEDLGQELIFDKEKFADIDPEFRYSKYISN